MKECRRLGDYSPTIPKAAVNISLSTHTSLSSVEKMKITNDGGDGKSLSQQTHIYIITLTIKLRDKDDGMVIMMKIKVVVLMRINTRENSAGNYKANYHDDQSKENAAGNDDADDDDDEIYIL